MGAEVSAYLRWISSRLFLGRVAMVVEADEGGGGREGRRKEEMRMIEDAGRRKGRFRTTGSGPIRATRPVRPSCDRHSTTSAPPGASVAALRPRPPCPASSGSRLCPSPRSSTPSPAGGTPSVQSRSRAQPPTLSSAYTARVSSSSPASRSRHSRNLSNRVLQQQKHPCVSPLDEAGSYLRTYPGVRTCTRRHSPTTSFCTTCTHPSML